MTEFTIVVIDAIISVTQNIKSVIDKEMDYGTQLFRSGTR